MEVLLLKADAAMPSGWASSRLNLQSSDCGGGLVVKGCAVAAIGLRSRRPHRIYMASIPQEPFVPNHVPCETWDNVKSDKSASHAPRIPPGIASPTSVEIHWR